MYYVILGEHNGNGRNYSNQGYKSESMEALKVQQDENFKLYHAHMPGSGHTSLDDKTTEYRALTMARSKTLEEIRIFAKKSIIVKRAYYYWRTGERLYVKPGKGEGRMEPIAQEQKDFVKEIKDIPDHKIRGIRNAIGATVYIDGNVKYITSKDPQTKEHKELLREFDGLIRVLDYAEKNIRAMDHYKELSGTPSLDL